MATKPRKAASIPGKAVATITIHGAAEMTDEGRKAVAEWLRQHAKDLTRQGKNYSRRFTGRYMVR